MRKRVLIAAAISILLRPNSTARAKRLHQSYSSNPVFPIADSSAPPPAAKFPTAQPADADHLRDALAAPSTRLLILPYASAFPGRSLASHQAVLRPRRQSPRPRRKALHPRRLSRFFRLASSRLQRPLHPSAHDRPVPGNSRLRRPAIPANREVPLQLPAFHWKRAFSPVIRLSAVDLYHRGGAAGSIDARLDTLAWGVKNGRKLSAPVIQVDHYRNGFDGGRWIFVNADLLPKISLRMPVSNPSQTAPCKAPKNSPSAPRCRSTFQASP